MTALEEFALEERLRRELRAEANLITPDSLPGLRLPRRAGRARAGQGPGGHPGPPRARPLFAAAAVVVVVAGTFTAARVISGPPPGGRATSATLTSLPRYYAYTLPETLLGFRTPGKRYNLQVTGRQLSVRATTTGSLVTSITPPKPYSLFTMVSADATGAEYVLGAARQWVASTALTSARYARTPEKFMMLRIAEGRAHLSGLSLPEAFTPGQQPSIALSPDGTRLAVAAGGGPVRAAVGRPEPAVVRVISLATGRQRQWTMARTAWTPSLNRNGAWTGNGRTLAITEQFGSLPAPQPRSPLATTTQVRLLDTTAPGSSLAASKLLVLHSPAHQFGPWSPYLTPDGSKLIASASTAPLYDPAIAMRESPPAKGELEVYSARTGTPLSSLASWEWRWPARAIPVGLPAQIVAWSSPSGNQLVLLQPRRDRNVLGVLTGGRFVAGGPPLPERAASYARLWFAIQYAGQLTW